MGVSGAELATVWVKLTFSAEGSQDAITKELGGVEKAAEKTGTKAGSRLSKGLKVGLAAAGTAAVAGFVSVFNTGMEELKFGEQISSQTDLLIKNTGAGFSTKWIEDYTLGLSKVSGVSEEALQSAGNTLLQFGITNEDTYKRAVSSINDMAAKSGNAEKSGKALAKALQDPTLAVGALRREGVAFTAEQEAMIKSMVQAGDVAGAQAVVLGQVEATYGGMAEAAGATTQGQLNKMGNAFENVAAMAVQFLLPAINNIVVGLTGFFNFAEQNEWVLPAVGAALVLLTAAVIAFTIAQWAANTAMWSSPVTWIIVAIVALIAIIVLLVMNWDTVVAFLTTVWNGFISWFTGIMDGFLGWWNGLWTAVWEWIVSVWNNIVHAVTTYFTMVFNIYRSIGAAIVGWWNGLWNGIASFFTGVWNGIVGVVNGVGSTFQSVFSAIAGFVTGAFNTVASVVRGVVNTVIGAVNAIINGINSVISVAGGLVGIDAKIPKLKGLYRGGTITHSGSVIVGERGPEILNLPRGASVDPNIDQPGYGTQGQIVIRFGDEDFLAVLRKGIKENGAAVYDVVRQEGKARS